MKLLKVPQFEQTFEYDCGAKAVQSVLAYYGFDIKEDKIMKGVGTNKHGTPANGIIKYLRKRGLKCKAKEGMTISDIKKSIDAGNPVILLIQAWPTEKVINWKNCWTTGHWVIAIGYNHESIIFDDPYILNRSYLHFRELEKRWHDKVQDLGRVRGYGIVVHGRNHYRGLGKIVHMN
jgi:ABC-type bacteriocin/lantibiotic exporter with double-glycine peptidase domain